MQCNHYTPISKGHGRCALDLFGGTPSSGICALCESRSEAVPTPEPAKHCEHWTAIGGESGSCAELRRAEHTSTRARCTKKSPPVGSTVPLSVSAKLIPMPSSGPGTELKKLLKWIGITSSPTCSCNAHARTMDEWGVKKCSPNIPEIVGWLREEAAKRKLPFVEFAAIQIVRLAIRRAQERDR